MHACHGPARQVEVLRDVVTGLLADDPTLEPRDVLVMCPDIEDYAPLISATFGLEDDAPAQEQHPGHRLRVKPADRSLRQTNPLLGTLATLLELADARVTASQVLDLAASPPVRRRFRFTDDDLERLQEWVVESGVRWGLDAPHRGRFGLQRIAQNTWRAGLDRILLGAAMAEDDLRWMDTALPLDDVDSTDIDLAGRLAELLDRLAAIRESHQRAQDAYWGPALQHVRAAWAAATVVLGVFLADRAGRCWSSWPRTSATGFCGAGRGRDRDRAHPSGELYHDDVMDEAVLRRSAPAANVRWTNAAAILTGDLLFSRAGEITADLGPEPIRILSRSLAVVCEGQIRESEGRGRARTRWSTTCRCWGRRPVH